MASPVTDAPATGVDELTELDQAKREKVFLAAKERFSRFGYKKTTVDEIADVAGISKRTMYQVFNSKEEILAELVMFEALTFRHHCASELKRHIDPEERLRIFCLLWRDYFADNAFLGQVISDEMGLFAPFLKNTISLVETGMKEIITRLLTDGVSRGAFRERDLPSTVDCTLVLLRRFGIETTNRHDRSDSPGWITFIVRAVKA